MKARYIGALITVVIIVLCWIFDRLKKRIARRCRGKGCGRTGLKRVYKILLPIDERISWKSPDGKWRLFIRRVVKITFSECKCGKVELVKLDFDPLFLWHAFWVKWRDKKQYHLDEFKLIEAANNRLRQLYRSGLNTGIELYRGSKQAGLGAEDSDTPPLSPITLLRDFLEHLENL